MKAYKIDSVLYALVLLIFKFSGCLVEEKNNIKILLPSTYENPYKFYGLFRKLHHNIRFGFPLNHWLIFFCVHCPTLIGCRKNPRKCTMHMSIAHVPGMIFWVKVAASGPLNRVTGRIF
jgi:hypothetical protein